MAQSGHAGRSNECPLLGVKRTLAETQLQSETRIKPEIQLARKVLFACECETRAISAKSHVDCARAVKTAHTRSLQLFGRSPLPEFRPGQTRQ